jgi:hypothetical protein
MHQMARKSDRATLIRMATLLAEAMAATAVVEVTAAVPMVKQLNRAERMDTSTIYT